LVGVKTLSGVKQAPRVVFSPAVNTTKTAANAIKSGTTALKRIYNGVGFQFAQRADPMYQFKETTMKNWTSRFVVLMVAGAIMGSALMVGCGGGSSDDTSNAPATTTTNSSTTTKDPGAE